MRIRRERAMDTYVIDDLSAYQLAEIMHALDHYAPDSTLSARLGDRIAAFLAVDGLPRCERYSAYLAECERQRVTP